MSLKLSNETPFSAATFEQLNVDGKVAQVLAVRGTFDIVANGVLAIADRQMPFVWSDEYTGDPQEGDLIRQADFVPFKPGTDITVRGHSHAPGGKPAKSWLCGIRVMSAGGGGLAEMRLRVHGPRYWLREAPSMPKSGLFGRAQEAPQPSWRLGEAQAVTSVPLRWRFAFGGPLAPEKPDGAPGFDMANPAGFGMAGYQSAEDAERCPAPLIEAADDPVGDPDKRHMPQNLAPILPAWRPRQQYAGTYDEAWQSDRAPLLPEDFDYRFYQCAHPDLIVTPHLSGGETVQLLNLNRHKERFDFVLPALKLERVEPGGRPFALRLDGVHINADAAQGGVELTWRAGFVAAEGVEEISLRVTGSREAAHG